MWSLRDRKQIGWTLLIFQAHCLETVYRPLYREECRQSLENSMSWGDRAESIGKPRWLQFRREWQPHKEKSSESCRGRSPSSIQQSTDQCMACLWGYYPVPGKEPVKMTQKNRACHSHRSKISAFPPAKLENLMIHRALGRVLRRVLPG